MDEDGYFFKKRNQLLKFKIVSNRSNSEFKNVNTNVNNSINDNSINDNTIKPAILKLNRKLLKLIFNELDIKSLARLSIVCKKFNYTILTLVEKLQVNVEWDEDESKNQIVYHTNTDYKQVTLNHCSPKDFFYPYPAFKFIKQLYLCFEDKQKEKIDLTQYEQLEYLKIRGAYIELSVNRLPNITHLDIDDPNNLQKQVARNLKNFHLEVDLETLRIIHNLSKPKMVEYVFTKSLDILLDKQNIEQISFTISMANMDLLLFEKMIDCLDLFLPEVKNNIKPNNVCFLLKYSQDPIICSKENKRWECAWRYLEEKLPKKFKNFLKLNAEELE